LDRDERNGYTMTKGPILFVSHDASPTGAPFLLLYLLRWLHTNCKLDFKVVLKKTGPLVAQFSQLAPVVVIDRPTRSLSGRIMERFAPQRLKQLDDERVLRRALGGTEFALVYSNTLVNGPLLESLPDQKCPLISHAHELEYMIQRHTTPEALAYTLGHTSQFIAGSAAVARNLIDNHGIDDARIEVVHEFIPVRDLDTSRLAQSGQRVRAELGMSEKTFVVGAAGTVDWRKGHDLFISLALEVLRARPQTDVHFVWVGGAWDRNVPVEIAYDLRKLGLEQRVRFVGEQSNYLDYLAMFDTLCLTSREDPFPLVVLECAALGTPVVCFARGGGSPEFVENDCGIVVPYLDIPAMAAGLFKLIDNPALRKEFGQCGRAKVRARHDVEVVGPRILEIIQRCLGRRRSRLTPQLD